MLIAVYPGIRIGFIAQETFCDGVRFPHQNVIGGKRLPLWAEENLNILPVPFSNGFFGGETLFGDILYPLCGKVVQIAPQIGNPFTRLRVDLLIDRDTSILLESQRLQRPFFPVHPEGHFRVAHEIAVLFVSVTDSDYVRINPFQAERHHSPVRLHPQVTVFAAGNLREQFCKIAVIQLRSGPSGLWRRGGIIPRCFFLLHLSGHL